ncbi:MAG: hypothetical protein ABIV10_06045 [Gemmatimonadaceae bacterium]
MLDELDSNGLGHGNSRGRNDESSRPLSDREVPIGSPRPAMAASVHAWLDGEATESQARRTGSSRDVDFWKRLDEDLATRRRLRTPAHLHAQIMNALPMHAPTLITPWWRREFVITPSSAIVVGTTLVVMAAAATALVFRTPL